MRRMSSIILLIIVVMSGCSSNDQQTLLQNKINVKTAKARSAKYSPVLDFAGTFYASREANLGAALPGRIEKIYIDEGKIVNEDELIVQMSGELLTQAEVEYETLKKDFQRVSRLLEKGSLADQKYDHVKAKFEASQARMELMQKNTQIKAPFSGVVVEHLMNEGESFFLNPGLKPGYSHASGIIRLMQLDPMVVKILVNEKDFSKIQKGQKAFINCDAFADTVVVGSVSKIKAIFSTTTHSAEVEIKVSNKKHQIKPGMFAHVKLELPHQTGVFIPRHSVIRQSGTADQYVFVVQEGIAIRKTIVPVTEIGSELVVKGIEADEQIITSGKNKIKAGVKLNVVNGGE